MLLSTLKEQLSIEPLNCATHIVVAYSGGVDSHVLLHALHNLKQESQLAFQLSAIHIHHGLSQHANDWEKHCQQVCEQLDIAFQSTKVAVQAVPRKSLEAQAREARYEKLIELAPTNCHLVLGQHQDDQVETFVLQLKRGAGPKGLSAMNREWTSPCRKQPNKQVRFYRPLLDTTQQVILDYAYQHKLNWCEDESNKNTDFERNFLRHDVLPILKKRWPEISRSVSRSASLCAEQQSLLDEICHEKLTPIKASSNSLHLSSLKALSQSWLHQIVRYWLSELNIQSPSQVVLNQLRTQVLDASEDATPILQWQDWQFRRFDQQLFVIKVNLEKVSFTKVWQGEKDVKLPCNIGHLVFSQTTDIQDNNAASIIINPKLGPILIRSGGYSIRFKPTGSEHSKPIKQWFKQWKIAPWLRETAMMVIQGEQVLAILLNGSLRSSNALELSEKGEGMVNVRLEK